MLFQLDAIGIGNARTELTTSAAEPDTPKRLAISNTQLALVRPSWFSFHLHIEEENRSRPRAAKHVCEKWTLNAPDIAPCSGRPHSLFAGRKFPVPSWAQRAARGGISLRF